MTRDLSSTDRDKRVLELYEQLLEVEQRLIPTGLHIFGQVPANHEKRDLLKIIASFDRPEFDCRSLPDLISNGLGFGDYKTLLSDSNKSNQVLERREQVESILTNAVETFIEKGPVAASAFLADTANVSISESSIVFALLGRVSDQLEKSQELDSLMQALQGNYIEPGPGADIIQNPDILPTGRNTHAVNPYAVPSALAWRRAEPVVAALLERHVAEHGRYPETMAMVLWGMDNIKTQGESVAQALWLLGVKPRRDQMNRVVDVDPISLEQLGRPRIDIVMTVSGIFRDLFGTTMEVLDKAVRCVATLDEPDEMNFVRRHVNEQVAGGGEGSSFDEAATRVFSNAAGNYGSNVNFMILDSQWEDDGAIADLFVTRKSFAYGKNLNGRAAKGLMEKALSRVEVTYQNLDTTEIGITDVDHYFEYLGGVSKAVEKQTGARPAIYLSDSLSANAKIRTLDETVRLETRTKTLNPKWYEGMLKHGIRGVAEIEHHISNTFGWSATADAVDNWVYDEIAKTFVLDEQMLDRLRESNPHSTHSLVGRLLEAKGRGFWDAEESVIDKLKNVFAGLEDQLEGI